MKTLGLLLVMFLLYSGSTDCGTAQETPSVELSVVRLEKLRNTGHHPENNRKVTFRLVNQSRTRIVLFGTKYQGGFEPTGYLITFDRSSGEWLYPTNNSRPVSWSETAREFKDKLILRPGESMRFIAEMSQPEVGGRFKRTVYIALEKDKKPLEVRSAEFILK